MHVKLVTAVLCMCVCVLVIRQADALSSADYLDLLSTLDNDGPNNYWPKRAAALTSLYTGSNSSDASDTASVLMHHLTKRQAGSGGTVLENKSFGECILPTGDKGTCRQVAFCPLPEIKNDVYKLLSQLCTIKETNAIGICCPDQFRVRSGPQVITNIDDNTLEQARIVNKPEQRGCGLTTKQFPRITGGRPAEAGEWPWMVALIRAREQFVWCGGVLVTDRHVLTAAHCLHKQDIPNMFIRLGEYNTHNLTETRARDFKIAAMMLHADYDPMTYENDIALVRVDRAALFNTYIWPICLPPLGENWEGRTAVVTGWGTTKFGGIHSSILMEAALPVWKHDECKKSLVMRIPDTTLCAGAPEGGQDSCQGDSGGPLMYQLPNNRWITIAIVSWGVRCGEPDHPGIYTRVDKYMNWIIQNSNI